MNEERKESVNAIVHRYAGGQGVAIDVLSRTLREKMLGLSSSDALEDLRVLAGVAMIVASETLAGLKMAAASAMDAKEPEVAAEVDRLVTEWRGAFERQYEADLKTFAEGQKHRDQAKQLASSFARAVMGQLGGKISVEIDEDDEPGGGRLH